MSKKFSLFITSLLALPLCAAEYTPPKFKFKPDEIKEITESKKSNIDKELQFKINNGGKRATASTKKGRTPDSLSESAKEVMPTDQVAPLPFQSK